MTQTTQSPSTNVLPAWAEEIRRVFRAGTVSQFLLYGNVFDLVPYASGGQTKFAPIKEFLSDILFAPFDIVLYYSRGAGIKPLRGQEHLQKYMGVREEWGLGGPSGLRPPKEAQLAMEFLDGFFRYCRTRTVIEGNTSRKAPLRTVLLVDFLPYLVPQADPIQMNDRAVETLIRLLDWASDQANIEAQQVTVLLSESLANVSRQLVENVYCAKIRVDMPKAPDSQAYLEALAGEFPELAQRSELPIPVLAQQLVGLTRVNIRHLVAMAVRNQEMLTSRFVSNIKKELIEKECAGLLEFIDSNRTLKDVAGLQAVKDWLSHDAQLIREGKLAAVPMGYLLTGRIGTGKTWLANCLAGEIGIPFVVLKNFRDKWQGATEGNLEKIFNVLKALGQVLVFVDEADQMTGKRSGGGDDSGLSGRIYGMLAKEMSDTANRGKVVWVFATSRPDLVEVDLKRPGRLDVHIPLFPPQTREEVLALFLSMAKKVGLTIQAEDVPVLPEELEIGGNEIEALMVRAQRLACLDPEGKLADKLAAVMQEYRPLPHKKILEYMDLQAVKECTDIGFLPPRYKEIPAEQVEQRLEQLKLQLGFTR